MTLWIFPEMGVWAAFDAHDMLVLFFDSKKLLTALQG